MERVSELPQIQITYVSQTSDPRDIALHVVVRNPSPEVLDELKRLLETQAIIVIGGVPKEDT